MVVVDDLRGLLLGPTLQLGDLLVQGRHLLLMLLVDDVKPVLLLEKRGKKKEKEK